MVILCLLNLLRCCKIMVSLFRLFVFLFLIIGSLDARSYGIARKKQQHIPTQINEILSEQSTLSENSPSADVDTQCTLLEPVIDIAEIGQPFVFMVRVLLNEKKVDQNSSWQISGQGFLISIGGKRWELAQTILLITTRKGQLFLNNKKCNAATVTIQPIRGHLHFNGIAYEGLFSLVLKEEKLHLINQLDIENYIYSVLRWESWPGWPLEVNKAFAIACRSYLIAKVLQAKKQNRFYHIKNTNVHQTYNGVHTSSILQRAIDETRGLILAHNQQPIEAMFDSCCGGIIPAKLSYVDFKKAPYLARTKQCTFCKSCKIYNWQISYTMKEFENLLHEVGHPVKDIQEVRITKKDDAGTVQQVMVKDAQAVHYFTGKEMYSILSKIKSFCYAIEKKGKELYFKGRGYGHHIGICQWGARRMIDVGWNFKSILQFYYPGGRLMALKNSSPKTQDKKENYA
jgi:stage II sporulation protein D (peptidoglycan lytic transglycosylase)